MSLPLPPGTNNTAVGPSGSTATAESAVPDPIASIGLNQLQRDTVASYRPPGMSHLPPPGAVPTAGSSTTPSSSSSSSSSIPDKILGWVYNPEDGSVMRDQNNRPISIERMLATNPLANDLRTRPGPGGKKLTYMSGDCVSRTLNEIFGYDGWNLDILSLDLIDKACKQDGQRQKFTLFYTAKVRLTHKASNTYKEEVGCGDNTDSSAVTAASNAMKSSITDAMKRAARHFGNKLGNSLYSGNFGIKKAPTTLHKALEGYDRERNKAIYGKDLPQVKSAPAPQPVPTFPSGPTTGTAATGNRVAQNAPRTSTDGSSMRAAVSAKPISHPQPSAPAQQQQQQQQQDKAQNAQSVVSHQQRATSLAVNSASQHSNMYRNTNSSAVPNALPAGNNGKPTQQLADPSRPAPATVRPPTRYGQPQNNDNGGSNQYWQQNGGNMYNRYAGGATATAPTQGGTMLPHSTAPVAAGTSNTTAPWSNKRPPLGHLAPNLPQHSSQPHPVADSVKRPRTDAAASAAATATSSYPPNNANAPRNPYQNSKSNRFSL